MRSSDYIGDLKADAHGYEACREAQPQACEEAMSGHRMGQYAHK